jgi:hypothetical protein
MNPGMYGCSALEKPPHPWAVLCRAFNAELDAHDPWGVPSKKYRVIISRAEALFHYSRPLLFNPTLL